MTNRDFFVKRWIGEGEPETVADSVFVSRTYRTADGRRFTVAALLAKGARVSFAWLEKELERRKDAFCEANQLDPATVTEEEAPAVLCPSS